MLRLAVDEFSKLITEISVSSRDEALCKEITACTWQKEKKSQTVVSFVIMFNVYSLLLWFTAGVRWNYLVTNSYRLSPVEPFEKEVNSTRFLIEDINNRSFVIINLHHACFTCS